MNKFKVKFVKKQENVSITDSANKEVGTKDLRSHG